MGLWAGTRASLEVMVIYQVRDGAGRIYSCRQELAFGRALGLVGILHRGFPRRLPPPPPHAHLVVVKKTKL